MVDTLCVLFVKMPFERPEVFALLRVTLLETIVEKNDVDIL